MKFKKSLKELFEFAILNIDKPSGPTSFDISDFVRKRFELRKTSHFGTLDPKVTGVLPIALNRACKLTGFFLGEDKEYVGIMRMHEEISLDKIKKMIKEKFTGKIRQTPPVKSRVKREEREREIMSFEILEAEEDKEQSPLSASSKRSQSKDILFRITVQGGTYIRKLIDDLGRELGIGAHMLELRRIRAGIFKETDKEFVNLYELEKMSEEELEHRSVSPEALNAGRKYLIPAEEAIKKIFPVVQVKEKSVKKLLTGKPILKEDSDEKMPERFAAFCGERFIGVYKKVGDIGEAEFVYQEMRG